MQQYFVLNWEQLECVRVGGDQTFPNNTHHFHFSECICTQFTDYKMLLRVLPFE